MPGSKQLESVDLDSAQSKLENYRVILDSMTYYELEHPDEINAKRIARVARGSGKSEADIRTLLREFKSMKNNLKALKGNRGFKKMLKNQIRSGNFGLDQLEDVE